MQNAERQVDNGIASVDTALGDPKAISPFFRIPGLGRTGAIEDYLASKSLMTWSADVVADDWKHIGASEIVRRAMRRLEAKGRGILLLHDIHPATALALPTLLKELKEHGYHIVHVVAAGERPESLPDLVASTDAKKETWPRVVPTPTKHEKAARSASRHHVKKINGKHRRPAVAGLHDSANAGQDWRQSQF